MVKEMTNRERALNILHYKPVDRFPAVHFGYWSELLQEWAEQGKISKDLAGSVGDGNDADRELDRIIGWDFNWQRMVGPANGLYPGFEVKVLEVLPDGTKRVQNGNGLIERVKPGITSIPSEDDYLLKDREAFETLYKPRMQYAPERIDLEYFRHFNETRPDDVPVGLHLGSVAGQIRDMVSVVGMSYLMYDEDEELFADIVDTYAEMQYQCAKAVLETGAKFDFAHYWEDICFKNGPLLDPGLFDEICAKHYKKRNDLCRQYGIDIISLDCDGVTEKLLPTWFENGVNTMFPIEVGVWGDQFEAARNRFGKGMLGVGGMDKIAFRKDKAAVDQEIQRMKRLASLGGFIPCPDHRLMPGSKFELVQYYAEEIKELSTTVPEKI
ncbi:uroporphyrinogen decarboxylase family protein [uncultured Acetatifactor sp.]|uniref:uroporphyrinogen decarboxylase family protein n=1 Tax=uncultured Acetatifactor sp. TaxID=1671927 RepID=UPI00260A5B83|nr:uroporphyrinogen decarboxylase family protein [uncultured Acetatifactor sp.]